MARCILAAAALTVLLPLATSLSTKAPDGQVALTQDGQESHQESHQGALDAATSAGQESFDGVMDSFAEILTSIGSRMWNETSEKEQSSVNATLDSVKNVIELWVKQDFKTSQDGISNQVQDLVGKTQVALDMKKKADEVDTALVACREAEQSLLIETQERLARVGTVREKKEDVCHRMRETQNFTWELLASPSGLCDFSDVTTEGVCLPFATLQQEISEKNGKVQANQTMYHDLLKECNQLMDDLDNLIRETTLNNVPGNTPYTKKRLECDQLLRQGNVAMCTFGDRLQEKCQAKSDCDSVTVKVYHQQEDRIAQWSASQNIKCKLLRFQNGQKLAALNVSVVPEPLANCNEDVYVNKDGAIKTGCVTSETPVEDLPCEVAADFARDVGTMDYMLNAIDSQMSEANFKCSEDKFKFSGIKWQTGAEPADYVKSEFAANASLTPLGSHPFSFCSAGADAGL